MRKFLEILKEEEEKVLSTNTSWGRTLLKIALAEAKQAALVRYYEEREL